MRQWTIDAFAAAPFLGNPACVLEPLDVWPGDARMQALASENNQAETAFLRRTSNPSRFDLRWFTPTQEVDLCGHATLASAHALMTELGVQADKIRFETRSGSLFVSRSGDVYEMDFPADVPRRIGLVEGLADALGAQPVEVWAARYLVAIMADARTVRDLDPDIGALALLRSCAGEPGQVIVCALSDPSDDVDVVDRFFAPGCGVAEDPATGSAHCILGPLYADRLNRDRIRFRQLFPGRGGDIETERCGDRTILRGRAVTVLESQLRIEL